jgi:hypothetical protein
MKSYLRLPVTHIHGRYLSFVGRFVLQDFQRENCSGSCYRMLSPSEVKKILLELSVSQLKSSIWSNYLSALRRAQYYNGYCQNKPTWSLAAYDDNSIQAIESLIKILEVKTASSKTDIGTVQISEIVDINRASARLSDLENKTEDKTEQSDPSALDTDCRRLAAVFDPNWYINHYSKIPFNPYLGIYKDAKDVIAITDSQEGLVSQSILYKSSCFGSLHDRYGTKSNKKYNPLEGSEKLKNSALVTSSTSSCWPIYGLSPVRSLCRFLEAMYVTLGPLQQCTNTLTPVAFDPLLRNKGKSLLRLLLKLRLRL